MEIDLENLRGWIGREDFSNETLTPAVVQRFNATLDRDSPTRPGMVAPLLIHLCLCQPALPGSALGEDGHPARGGFLPPVPLPRRMWAGGAFTFHAPIVIGQTVARNSVVTDVQLKRGRSGLLCFVTVEHRIMSDERLAVTERQDIVYREPTGEPQTGAPAEQAPAGTHRLVVAPSATLLFRYSALTFNGHRIHYDVDYARNHENYPGLVVHGPMQATMLANFAADLHGAPPAEFSFVSRSPLFHNNPFAINAAAEEVGMRLWTARPGGPVAMEASAKW